MSQVLKKSGNKAENIISQSKAYVASSPGSQRGFTVHKKYGKWWQERKRAWYEPFVHAQIIPGMSGIGY